MLCNKIEINESERFAETFRKKPPDDSVTQIYTDFKISYNSCRKVKIKEN